MDEGNRLSCDHVVVLAFSFIHSQQLMLKTWTLWQLLRFASNGEGEICNNCCPLIYALGVYAFMHGLMHVMFSEKMKLHE